MSGSTPKIQSALAGCFGTLQAVFFISVNIIHCLKYFNSLDADSKLGKWLDVNYDDNYVTGLKAMLLSQIIMNVVWLFSSLILLIGSNRNLACMVRQWAVITTLVIVTSLICSCYFLSQSVPALKDQGTWESTTMKLTTTSVVYKSEQTTTLPSIETKIIDTKQETGHFAFLYVTLSNGTILLWVLNIVFAFVVHQRAKEIDQQTKVKPGFGATAFGNMTATRAKSPAISRIESMNSDRSSRGSSRNGQQPVHPREVNRFNPDQGRRDSPFASRSNRYEDEDDEKQRVPMAHLGREPYTEPRRQGPTSYHEDDHYDGRFGSAPVDMEENGNGGSNFVMKRKSVYDYETNPAEIEARMARLEHSDSSRRLDQVAPLASRLKPPIYQPTAFEPKGRRPSQAPSGHQPLVRSSGGGRGAQNNGYVSADDEIRSSHRRNVQDRRGYQSEEELNRNLSPLVENRFGRGRWPMKDNPLFNYRDERPQALTRSSDFQEARGHRNEDMPRSPNTPEYQERGYFHQDSPRSFTRPNYATRPGNNYPENAGDNRGQRRY